MQWLVKQIRGYQSHPNLACAFGVILYRDRDVHVAQAIEDDRYCKALNEISGSRWMIFASRPERRQASLNALRLAFRGTISDEWRGSEDQLGLLKSLGVDSSKELPCLHILCADMNTEIAYVQSVRISGKSVDETFESICEAVALVTEALDGLDPRYMKNAEDVHRVIAMRLQDHRHWQFARKSVPFLTWLLRKTLAPA